VYLDFALPSAPQIPGWFEPEQYL